MNPIWTHGLVSIQMEQQIPHMFRVSWEFIIPVVTVLQLRAPGVPKPIISIEDGGEEGIKCLCFAYVIVCEVTFPIK